MLKSVLFSLIAISSLSLFAQQDPVHWSYKAEKSGDKTFKLHITATIDKGWHLYAQQQPEEAISIPTKIEFTKNPLVIIKGAPKELGKKEIQDLKEIGIKQYYYSERIDFVQLVQLKSKVKTNVLGSITYQACTNERCLPDKTINFTIPISN